jgi:hypothetical protein
MAYQATGKPAGRPRKDGQPAGSVKQPEAQVFRSAFDAVPMQLFASDPCPECFPGVTKFNALTCAHGTRIKPV